MSTSESSAVEAHAQGKARAVEPVDSAAGQADIAAEQIIPPEQPPMDDAAGGPQAEDPDAPVDDEATRGRTGAAESEAHPS